MRKLIACIALLGIIGAVKSQDFSNKGKEFYLCFPNHVPNNATNLATLSLYITSDKASSGTVTMGNGAFSASFNITANGIQEIQIPWNTSIHIANNESNTVLNKSIRIKTDPGQPAVVAYAQQWAGARSAATLLLPVNVLGKKYYAVSFTQSGANQGTFLGRSQFQIIAVKNNTVVTITPRKNGVLGAPITITLPLAGDLYQYQSQDGNAATQDLTGTLIESVASGTGGCLPIAVFSGSSNVTFGISSCNTGTSYDPLFQQLYPTNTWGKNFGVIPFEGYPNGNPVRVIAADSNTRVFYNGTLVATLNPGEFYPAGFNSTPPVLAAPTLITSDKPVCVAQYAQRANCSGRGGNLGDPDMVILNPIEQNISDITIFSSAREAITEQWVNVLLKTVAVPSFKINGVAPSGSSAVWTPMATLPGYSYLRYSMVGISSARIVADSGFNAISYGWGNVESYAYSAGTNVKDLYQQVRVSSLYGIEETPSVCAGSPFRFKVSLPYLVDSMRWNLSALPGNPGSVLKVYSNPPVATDADSVTVVNGKTIYWYSLPTLYTFNTPGQYPVSISTYAPNSVGCGNEQLIDFELEVSNPPVADYNFVHNGCINQDVQFNDATTTTKPVYKWYWNFGDVASGTSNTSFLQNPTHQFSSPGTYTVKFANITTPGCLSDTIEKQVIINPLPKATLAGNINVCQNAPPPNVIFTGTVGTAPFTFTYNINNGTAQTIVTTSGNSVSLPVPTSAIGTFNYHLVSVKDAAGTAGCFQNQPDTVKVTVSPLPTATISGNATICQNGTAPNITFTGANAANTPYTFSYNMNGGTTQTITTVSGNSIALPVSTATPGTFVYNLLSVKDASTTACSQAQTGSATVTINPLPTATINGTTEVCLNAASPLVTFTGAGSMAPYTFTYTLNGGASQTIVSSGNTATISVPTSVAGSFAYQLVSVKDASANTCTQLQGGNATVVVNPLPVYNFTVSSPTCISSPVTFTDNSLPGVGTFTSWLWNFNDPASGAANTSTLQNPVHTFNAVGTYNVTLVATNSKGCVNLTAGQKTVTINAQPKAGFILPEVCLSDTYAQFNDTSKVAAPSNVNAWLWSFGDPGSGTNNSATTKNPQHSYTAVGSYNVTLTVTTNAGCKDTITQALFVNGSFPVANFTINNATNLCANDSVAIVEASTVFPGSITKVEIYWDNAGQPAVFDADDFPVSGKIYKHLYPDFQSPLTKVYTIRYRAYSGGVCVNDKLQNITVNAAPSVQFSAIPDACLDAAPFQITQAREMGNVPGSAVFSGPGVSASGIFNPAAVGAGTYRLFYRFTSAAGGCVDTASQVIKVLAAPVADYSVSPLQCAASAIGFTPTATTPEGTLTNWSWNFGDGSPVINSTNSNPVSHTFASAGTYPVSLIVITSNGCRSTAKIINVVVNGLPYSAFALPAGACLPAASVSFTNQSSTGTYLWNFGDAASGNSNTSTAVNPTHIYTSAGPFDITLKTTNAAGCSKDTVIIFNAIHPQPAANFTTDLAATCLGSSIGFIDASDPMDGSTTQWNWKMGNNTTQSQPDFSYTYPAAGVYTVSLTIVNNFGCTSTEFSRSVTIYPYPTVDAGANKFVLEGGSVVLEPIVTGTNLNYLWEPPTYLSATNIAKPVSAPLADITYKVTVSYPGGCSASDTVSVKVLKGPKIPNTFSPNGDGINEKWVIEYLDTYPNNRVQVFTRAGQLVFESRGYKTPWNGTMNGKTLPIDTYYYIIEPGNGRKPLTGYVTILK